MTEAREQEAHGRDDGRRVPGPRRPLSASPSSPSRSASLPAGSNEVWEWFIHHSLNAPIYVTYDDTITDMIDNALGSLTGGLVLMTWARRGWGTRRRPAPLGAPS